MTDDTPDNVVSFRGKVRLPAGLSDEHIVGIMDGLRCDIERRVAGLTETSCSLIVATIAVEYLEHVCGDALQAVALFASIAAMVEGDDPDDGSRIPEADAA